MLAVDEDDDLWLWGFQSAAPQMVGNVGPVAQINLGGGQHALILTTAGQIWALPLVQAFTPALGAGPSPAPGLVAVSTSSGLTSAVSIGANGKVSGAIDAAGNLWMWGDNTGAFEGMYGDGTMTISDVPRLVPKPAGMGTLVDISLGGQFATALNSAGEVWSWGSDNAGTRGDGVGETEALALPTKAVFPVGVTVRELAAGSQNAVIADTQNRLWWFGVIWGANGPQLSSVPVLETRISNVNHVEAGDGNLFASTLAGELYSWGKDQSGELGQGTFGVTGLAPARVLAAKGQPGQYLSGVGEFSMFGGSSAAIVVPFADHETVASDMLRGPTCTSSVASRTKVCGLTITKEDPVSVSTGAFMESMVDLTLPGKGLGFEFVRTYDSQVATVGPLGAGWSHQYVQSVSVNAGTGVASWVADGGKTQFAPDGNGGFTAPPGMLARLSSVAGGGWLLTTQDQIKLTFDATGKLTSMVDRSGSGVTLAYNAQNRIATVTDSSARIATFTYPTSGIANGRLTQVKTSDNRTVKFGYTTVAGQARLTTFTDERAKVTTYGYNSNGYLTSVVDQNSNPVVTNIYDSQGRVTYQTDPLGQGSNFVWDDIAEKVEITDPTGAASIHDTSGLVIDAAVIPSGITRQFYDNDLNIRSYVDATGQEWKATHDDRGNQLTRTSPLGYVESWTYDAMNNPLSHTDARGAITTMTYDTNGRQLTEARPLGVNLSWSWNPDGTLASSTDPRGGISLFTYDTNGNMLSSITPLGFKTSYTYDAAGRVLTITEPRGNVAGAVPANFQQKFSYDADGNVLTEKDALNRTTTNVYDSAGRKTKSTAPDGGVTLYTYNAANELISQTNPDLGVATYEYDNRGMRTKETSPIGAITTFAYDPSGRLVLRVDPRGNEPGGNPSAFSTTYVYDAENRVTLMTDQLGRVTTYTYDVQGRRVSETRPDGTTTSVYDSNGNVISMTAEAGTSSSVFDALNRVTVSTDPRGKTSTVEYDLAGNRVAAVDPLGRRSTSVFDADGRVVTSVDPRGNAIGGVPADFDTLMTYDEGGNALSVTDPIGNVTLSTYDRVGNVASVKNPRLQTTSYVYDTMNRVSRVTAPVVGATNYVYSTSGNMVSRTDPLLRVSTWQYDTANRLTRQTDPLGRFMTYAYDVAGNRTQVTDAVANAAANPTLGTTDMVYDSLNRLTSRSYSDGTPPVSYSYDSQGRRSQMSDGSGVTTYGFDAADRVSSVSRGVDVFSYVYDANGNVTSRSYPDGSVVAGVFDDAGQQVSVTEPAGTVTFAYDVAGNPLSSSFPNGVTRTTSFDSASRVTAVTNSSAVGVLSKFTYSRDANGNPVAIDYSNGAGLVPAESQRLTYDTFDRLTKVCQTATLCATANQTLWSYDKNGNRVTEKVGAGAVSTYTYDVADQLTAITGTGAKVFTYNGNGDQVTSGADVSTFNSARQTTSSTVGGVATTYAYDGNGNRHTITTAGTPTSELWDTVGGLPNLALERSGAGVVQRRYTYGRGSETLGYSDPVAATQGWYLTDALGSVANITNSSGANVATYTYNPFGVARLNTTSAGYTANPLRYTGQHLDPTGNYNLRARQYNPGLGRFTQTDPLDNPGSAYSYVGNNPTSFGDPSGLRRSTSAFGGGNTRPNPDCSSCDLSSMSHAPLRSPQAVYGSRPAGNRERKQQQAFYALAAGGSGPYKTNLFASKHLFRFLQNSGQDIVDTFDSSSSYTSRTRSRVFEDLEKLRGEMGPMLADANTPRTFKYQTTWQEITGAYADTGSALHLGMGKFYMSIVGNRSPSGKWCEMVQLEDWYYFYVDPGLPADSQTIDRAGVALEETGLAKPFKIFLSLPTHQ